MSKPQKLGDRVHLHDHFVYYNLHKRCWSLRANRTEGAGPTGLFHRSVKGRVTGHADTIVATRVTCKVGEAGRQRVIREGRKNVHAGLNVSTAVAHPRGVFHTTDRTPKLCYNPYKRGEFYDRETGATVTTARYVVMFAGRDGCPPRVYYGHSLYYAVWADHVVRDGRAKFNGFVDATDLHCWIGQTEFTGYIARNGLKRYNCHDGALSYPE